MQVRVLLGHASPHIVLHMVRYSDPESLTFAALSDPTRRRVLDRLAQGPASVAQLAAANGLSMPGMLKHLHVLERAALVRTLKSGRVRRCGLAPVPLEGAARYLDTFRGFWERRPDALAELLRTIGA
jgi:DNA-binding transcriptional ArsR family regulator